MSIPVKMTLEWLAHENAQLNRQVTDLQARGTELVEENRRLRAALNPLAEAADYIESSRMERKLPDETGLWLPQSNVREVRGITLGDARRAREVLAPVFASGAGEVKRAALGLVEPREIDPDAGHGAGDGFGGSDFP